VQKLQDEKEMAAKKMMIDVVAIVIFEILFHQNVDIFIIPSSLNYRQRRYSKIL